MTETVGRSVALAEVLAAAARAVQAVRDGRSLDRAIAAAVGTDAERMRAAVQAISYAAVRYRALTDAIVDRLTERSPDAALLALLSVALSQLIESRRADYAIVDQTVSAARVSRSTAPRAGFINAVLRNFLRSRDALLTELRTREEVRFNSPSWWIERVRAAVASADDVLASQIEPPPLVVRVNLARGSVEACLERFAGAGIEAVQIGPQAVWVREPRPVTELPGFERGLISVQDAGAQLAASWLDVADGMDVLDACAAPGGKTAHLSELAALDLVALEVDADRATRIDENLRRIGTSARVVIGDARTPSNWWDKRPFDRILLDAPCTASGIVRRHPDVPWLRRPTDVAQLTTVQGQLLDALWPLLRVGGRLLYVVCSIFPEEGKGQVERFLRGHADTTLVPLPVGAPFVALRPTRIPESIPAWNPPSPLPTLHDGFFYALIEKTQ